MIDTIKNWFGIYPTFGGVARSPLWSSVRKQHLKRFPMCAVCGKKGSLLRPISVHHLIPFHMDKSQELREENLLSVCKDHHFFVCHLMSWRSWNKDAVVDCQIWNEKLKNRP